MQIDLDWSRRDFLKRISAGAAVLSVPTFLAGCATRGDAPANMTTGVPDNPFLAWFGLDEAKMQTIMSRLTQRGADMADLYFQHSRSTWINMEDGIISRAYSSIDQGVGLRVVIGGQTGYAFTEDLSIDAILAAAETATTIAKGSARPAPSSFEYAAQGQLYHLQTSWQDVGVSQKLPLIRRLESLARGMDPSVEKVSVSWNDSDEKVLIATLDGHVITDNRPMTRVFCNVTARKGEEVQSNYSNVAAREGIEWYTEERLKKVASEAVDRTMVLFEARRPPAGDLPVALAAGASGILLHEAIGHGMEADFNRKNVSIYSEMIGKKVAPEFVTIVDDGTLPNERGSLNYDDEGNPCEKTLLVENGILRSYLHDRISAKHYGLTPTGSGRRQSFRYMPMPRMRCTYMEDGPHTKEEIIASMEKGIIAETFTNGQVDIGGGDFTFYIKNGWMVEKGKITHPIKDANIIGNGPEILKRVSMVGNDNVLDTGGWTCGKAGQSVPVSQGMPTVLISSMTVGGENA